LGKLRQTRGAPVATAVPLSLRRCPGASAAVVGRVAKAAGTRSTRGHPTALKRRSNGAQTALKRRSNGAQTAL